MSVKSKYGAGGEYSPEWKPKASFIFYPAQIVIIDIQLGDPAIEGPPAPAIEGAPAAPARPAWRTVHKRPPRKEKKAAIAAAPAPAIEAPKPELPAWAQWRRINFLL
jgi:hypothetical protein